MTDTAIVQAVMLFLVIASAPGMVALWLFVRGLSRRVDGLESLRLLDAADRAKLQRRVDELEHGVGVLIAQIRRAGMTPEWSPAPTPAVVERPASASGQQAETEIQVDLWQRIEACFDQDEMRDLAYELQLPVAAHSISVGEQARKLVNDAKRRSKLDELREICRRDRPEGGF